MAPTRTHKPAKKQHNPAPNPSSITPGVSKLKASLRQTQRLLAKDNLAADVRVKTERRLKGLQDELAEAELSNKEKALSARYHGIKFFERQKVTRKIKQLQKPQDTAEGSSNTKQAEALLDARVDLNYILHYPRLKKYISLFPPEARNSQSKPTASSDTSKTDALREEIRSEIRQQMLAGELSSEPEVELSTKHPQKRQPTLSKPTKMASAAAYEEVEDDGFFGEDDS